MDDSNIPDYKLDGRFLKEFMLEMLEKPSAKEFTLRLPVLVQVVRVIERKDEWNLYFLADGEFGMSRCGFVSKQDRPERFSILKIKKITKLANNIERYSNDYDSVGEIEFDTVVSGEQIGFCQYKDLKDINVKELMERKAKIGCTKVKTMFKTPKPMEIMKHMWENRSEKFCDINFTFDEGVVFAHRSVLVAASEVFKAHTDNEGFIDNKSVNIVDVSHYSFNKLLEFIYMGNVQFTTWRLAFDLLYLSKKYLMSDLEKLCQSVIKKFCDYDAENVLKVFEENRKVNDLVIMNRVKSNVRSKIYEVINSKSYLNCEFSTVEWIMSLNFLPINEWSRLCAIYKWAVSNETNAFCDRTADESRDCLHALLEYVRYENIDGLSIQRFLKLSKLPEVVSVSELKLSIFDSLLEDGSLCLHNGNNYPKYRSFGHQKVYAEIEIGSSEEIKMKDILLDNDGPVLGFKITVEVKKLANGEHSLDIVPSFRYLYSRDEKKDAELDFRLRIIKTRSGISVCPEDITFVVTSANLNQGEWKEFRLHLKDCRGYLSDRIEDFGVKNSGEANRLKIISLDIDVTKVIEGYVVVF